MSVLDSSTEEGSYACTSTALRQRMPRSNAVPAVVVGHQKRASPEVALTWPSRWIFHVTEFLYCASMVFPVGVTMHCHSTCAQKMNDLGD